MSHDADESTLLVDYFFERCKEGFKPAERFFVMQFVCLRSFLCGIMSVFSIRRLREYGRRKKSPHAAGFMTKERFLLLRCLAAGCCKGE